MPIIFGTTASGGDKYFTPQPPTIGTATNVGTSRAYNNGAATVTFTPSTSGGAATSFTATSTPGSFTGSASSSPITVAGLQSATSYTFAVTATDAEGTSSASAASNSITATTVPQAPTIGSVTLSGTTASVPFTANATGGSSVTTFTATSSPGGFTGTSSSSPISVSGLSYGTAYTFIVTATNANGTSTASSTSNSVTPSLPSLGSWSTISTANPTERNYPAFASTGSTIYRMNGNNVGGQSDSYYWNGSSWSGSFSLPNPGWRAAGAWDGTYVQYMGGFNSATTVQKYSYYTSGATGTSFSTGTSLPTATGAQFGGAIGNAVVTSTQGGTTYYRTGTGSWSTGASYGSPVNAYATSDPSLRGTLYIVNSSGTFYSNNNPSNAYTANTSYPVSGGSALGFIGSLTFGSTDCVWYGAGQAGGTEAYRWDSNSNAWTAQTSIPANVQNGESGIISSVLYAWYGDTSANVKYKATIA